MGHLRGVSKPLPSLRAWRRAHDAVVGESENKPPYRRRPVAYDEDGFPVVPKRRQRTWAGLRWSEQRAVLRAARHGESHPDPAIAKAARDWARDVLAPRPPSRRLLDGLLRPLEDPFGGTLGQLLGERRAARRILAVGPPQQAGRHADDCP
jgi:hypothetical protein